MRYNNAALEYRTNEGTWRYNDTVHQITLRLEGYCSPAVRDLSLRFAKQKSFVCYLHILDTLNHLCT